MTAVRAAVAQVRAPHDTPAAIAKDLSPAYVTHYGDPDETVCRGQYSRPDLFTLIVDTRVQAAVIRVPGDMDLHLPVAAQEVS